MTQLGGSVRGNRKRYLLIASLVALSGLPGLRTLEAKDGRDFAGSYELRDVVDQGDQVNGRFLARIFNYSDRDIQGATVILEGLLLPGDPYAQWPSLSIFDRQSVKVEAWVTLPKQEYEQWRQGARPRLAVEFQNQAGDTYRNPVELVQLPVGEEN